jgi:hypothetical protein
MASKAAASTAPAIKVSSVKPKALSLHVGLNAVSPAAYGGWDGPLAACEFDANDMAALAKSKGIKPTVLLTKKGTRAAVLSHMRAAAKALKAGDLYLLTYSGHGGQVGDINGDEPDHQDETWCLYDGQLIDDELYLELSRFAAGVRVLVLSDSCHSGSVVRDFPPPPPPPGQRVKLMPAEVARRVYAEHKDFYDQLQINVLRETAKATTDPDAALALVGAASHAAALVGVFKPAVLLISGCQDNQTSMDGDHNGAFTGQLLKIWNGGAFTGNYASFHARIRAGLPPTQSPNLFVLGSNTATAAFVAQKPFTV